jgi:hypothetical protein
LGALSKLGLEADKLHSRVAAEQQQVGAAAAAAAAVAAAAAAAVQAAAVQAAAAAVQAADTVRQGHTVIGFWFGCHKSGKSSLCALGTAVSG